jgi:hypothetical protein
MPTSSKLPVDAKERKSIPLARGLLDYFPDALIEVARVSQAGNEQHHAGAPLHWDKSKSTDEADALMRHLIDRGKFDKDRQRHSAKVAWRALALLQRELDAQKLVPCGTWPTSLTTKDGVRWDWDDNIKMYVRVNIITPEVAVQCGDQIVKDRQTLMEEIAEEKQ